MKIAVMDFSSTALSLLVAEVSRDSIEPVVGLRRTVSILDYMSRKGKLSERGVEKVVEAVTYLEEAAKKGTLAKLAAQKAGDKLVEEAEKQAANLEAEAERQIGKLTAQKE